MAGWDVLMQPFIYHPPVAPEVPKADNTAANIISRGSLAESFLHAAALRQQSELESKRMVQDAALRMQGYGLEARGQDLSYEAAKERIGIEQQNADTLESYRQDSVDVRKEAADAATKSKIAQADLVTKYQTGLNDLNGRAYVDAKPLLDPNLPVDDPGALIKGYVGLDAKYGSATDGAAPKIVSTVRKRVDALTVPFVRNAQLVNPSGESTTSGDQPLGWFVPKPTDPSTMIKAEPKPEKLLDLYHEYQTDPRGVERGLIAAGHGSIDYKDDGKGGKVATPKLDEWASNLLKNFGKKTANSVNQVPSAYMSTHPLWQVKAGAGADSTPPEGDLPEDTSAPAGGDPFMAEDVKSYGYAKEHFPDKAASIEATWNKLHPGVPLPDAGGQ